MYLSFDFVVVQDSFVTIEQIRPKFVGPEDSLALLGLLLLVVLPIDIVLPFKRITHIFDGLEVIRKHPFLRIALELPRLRFDFPISLPISLGLLLRVVLINMLIC